jgi:hypothetical protein
MHPRTDCQLSAAVWAHEPLRVYVGYTGGALDFGVLNGFVSLGFTGLTLLDLRLLDVRISFEKRWEVRP